MKYNASLIDALLIAVGLVVFTWLADWQFAAVSCGIIIAVVGAKRCATEEMDRHERLSGAEKAQEQEDLFW